MSDELTAVERLQVYQHVNRVWRPHLSVAERDFIFYLIDNSIAWGRRTVRATIAQMATGKEWLPSSGITLRSLERVVASLLERDVIRRSREDGRTYYSLNTAWMPEMTLRTPKRLSSHASTPVRQEDFLAPAEQEHTGDEQIFPPNWRNQPAKLAPYIKRKLKERLQKKATVRCAAGLVGKSLFGPRKPRQRRTPHRSLSGPLPRL